MREIYVGIDGGGTRARAVATDGDGIVVARVAGGPGLVDPRDPGAAAATVAGVTREVLREAGVRRAAALCCGLAGAGRPQEREAVRVALTIEDIAAVVVVTGDGEAAMADAFPSGSGVLVVAGTGSIAWARSADGRSKRVGGWGQLLGDEGSGYAIGLAALRSAVRAADRGSASALGTVVLDHAGVAAIEGLVPWAAAASKAMIAALAPRVLQLGADGDGDAAAIRDAAVADLVELAQTAAAHAGTAPAIAFAGGLIGPGGALREHVAAALTRVLPDAAVLERAVDAAAGAARLAREAGQGA